MFKKLLSKDNVKDGSIIALVVGGIAALFGVDIAPTEVDAIVTGVATIVLVSIRIKDRIKAE